MLLNTVELTSLVNGFMLPFLRIGAVLFSAPVFGTRLVPVKIKIGLTLCLTLLIVPLIPKIPNMDILSFTGLAVSFQQLLIGVSLGFTLHLVFGALILAGESMAMSMGLGFASMIDPQNGVNVPVVSQFFVLLATLIYLSLNGHIVLLSVLADSFHSLPISTRGLSTGGYWTIVAWASFLFSGAVKIALPVVATLLITYIALGVMTRAAPQLNIFSVGFPVTMLTGFVIMLLAMPSLPLVLSELLESSFSMLGVILGG